MAYHARYKEIPDIKADRASPKRQGEVLRDCYTGRVLLDIIQLCSSPFWSRACGFALLNVKSTTMQNQNLTHMSSYKFSYLDLWFGIFCFLFIGLISSLALAHLTSKPGVCLAWKWAHYSRRPHHWFIGSSDWTLQSVACDCDVIPKLSQYILRRE